MVDLWNNLIVDGASGDDKKDENYWEVNLIDFIYRVYTILYTEAFKYNYLDPTNMAFGDSYLKKERLNLVNNCINIDKGKKTK
jgi:hypothetical protein